MSRKKTYRADRIIPTPILNSVSIIMGYMIAIILNLNVIPSTNAKIKKTTNGMLKLIDADTHFENRNKYLGTLIFVNICALAISEFIPPFVCSLKYENIRFPAKRYVV